MKKTFKRLFKTAFFRTMLVMLAANYIRLVYYTSRKRIDVDESARPYMSGEKNAVFSFWHGRMLMTVMIKPKGRQMNVLISSHRDGEMIARVMQWFGLGTVRGSTSRGGVMAGKGAMKALQDGENLCITPDGPRGPALKVQKGVVSIAEMAKLPVVPVAYSSSRHRRIRSWDRFMVALPFGRLYYKIGAAMWDATPEALELAMVTLTQEADAYVRVVS